MMVKMKSRSDDLLWAHEVPIWHPTWGSHFVHDTQHALYFQAKL